MYLKDDKMKVKFHVNYDHTIEVLVRDKEFPRKKGDNPFNDVDWEKTDEIVMAKAAEKFKKLFLQLSKKSTKQIQKLLEVSDDIEEL